MTEPKFVVGQRVKRIEDRAIVGAVVLEVVPSTSIIFENTYHIQYDEGPTEGNDGTGWWPENSLEAE
jgi:hypothetical protein